MSEIRTNKITSVSQNRKLTIGTGLEIVSSSEDNAYFQTTDDGSIKIFGSVLLGSQTGSTHGIINQIVAYGGTDTSPRWQTYVYVCPTIDSSAPKDSVYTYFVPGFFEGCGGSTAGMPSAPKGFLYCDGSNGTPDFRITNTLTGLRSFEGSCKGTLIGTGMDSYLVPGTSTTWTLAYIIKS